MVCLLSLCKSSSCSGIRVFNSYLAPNLPHSPRSIIVLPSCDFNNSDKMSYLKHFLGDGIEFPILILHYKLHFSEILGYTASRQLSQMLFAIVFFHGSEYLLAAVIHGRSNITLKSLLVSRHYVLAMIFSMLEYIIEIILVPEMKEHWVLSNLGLALVVIGEIVRKMGILTAWKAFTHLIKIYHDNDHKLITHGIYGYIRHPGYCGFLVWSVGTQIMLCNPISTIAFAAVVWRFFSKRIPYEEFFLRQFFGREYEQYARRVRSGVPFVK